MPERSGSRDPLNFFADLVRDHPGAVSFGPGFPLDSQLDVSSTLAHLKDHLAAHGQGPSSVEVYDRLGQYTESSGIIREEIARYLRNDEDFDVAAADIVVTVGCQEAMLLVLMALFESDRDVLLVADPAYVGFTGLATSLRIHTRPVPQALDGLDPDAVAAVAAAVRAEGRVPRALYHVPTFNNPLGTVMTLEARHRLLRVAREHDFYILEDNAYGALDYDGPPPPTLANLDRTGHVIYLNTFSKTLFPGLRVGFLVHRDPRARGELLALLRRIKSLTTVTTSALMQAVVGGVLRANGYSLRPIIERKRDVYRRQRDQMLESLASHMVGKAGVTWNRPSGGFFLVVTLPFEFDDECVRTCAREHGVICLPMRHFTSTELWNNAIRLSFSYTTPAQIHQGIAGLARFVESRQL